MGWVAAHVLLDEVAESDEEVRARREGQLKGYRDLAFAVVFGAKPVYYSIIDRREVVAAQVQAAAAIGAALSGLGLDKYHGDARVSAYTVRNGGVSVPGGER